MNMGSVSHKRQGREGRKVLHSSRWALVASKETNTEGKSSTDNV